MKKILLIIALVLGITASANAQVKNSGFKVIGTAGFGISWVKGGIFADGLIGHTKTIFGSVDPQLELTAGGNVSSNLFIGVGIGYEARCGVRKCDGTQHELKVPATLRFYVSPESSEGFILDIKGGYSRLFANGDNGINGGNLFIGPGYIFDRRFALSLGYEGSYVKYSEMGETFKWNFNGIAAKFSMEI